MARALLRFSEPDAVYWVQDYHFLTLGAEMRRLQISRPIGFFLHTPWADRRTMAAVPHHAELVQAMLAYDLVGFQTDEDRQNFEDYLQYELNLPVYDGTVTSSRGVTHLATFPDRHRCRRVQRPGYQSVGPCRAVAAARQPAGHQAGAWRRPSGLFQGPRQPDAGVRPDARHRAAAQARRRPFAGRGADAWQYPRLSRAEGRACFAGRRDQRPAWRGRLDSDPLSQQELLPAHACRILSRGPCRLGHAAARRHEPGREGICRGAKPLRSGRPGAVGSSPAPRRSSMRRFWSIRTISTEWPGRSPRRCS